MPYENLKTIDLEEIVKYYDSTFKAFIRAKDILDKDSRIAGKELEQKKNIISLLEETFTLMRSAKIFYDKGQINLAKAELKIVDYRLQYTKKLSQSFPYRTNCEVEKIILNETRRISDLYSYILDSPSGNNNPQKQKG